MTATTAGETSHALNLSEAIPLLHGLIDEVARALGVRVLFIKGPILTAQGLRSTHQSVDVDVLVDPERLSDLQQGLERLGWAVRVPSTSAQVLPPHSATYAHPVWPCEVDVHNRFPGFLAEPQATFESLWAHRTIATVAGREVPCLEPVAHFAIACLHVLRDLGSPGKRDELDRLVEVAKAMFDTDQRSRLGVLAARTGSLGTLRPVLEARASSPGVRSVGWVAQLGRTPLRRWPATLVHALLLTEAEIRDAQPHAARGRWGLLRARLRRLGLGLRDVPRACMIIRRARRESVAGR
jgi:hypothetical protein